MAIQIGWADWTLSGARETATAWAMTSTRGLRWMPRVRPRALVGWLPHLRSELSSGDTIGCEMDLDAVA